MSRINLWEAVATMVGTIIGAGIFAIPYVVAKAGFWTGVLDIIIIGAAVFMMYLYLGEVVLRTHGKHQLTGYAEKYLGKWGKRAMMFAMLFGVYGALTAYIIGEGSALSSILGGSPAFYSIAFFIVVAYLTYFGLETLEKSELFSVFLLIIAVIAIVIFTSPHIKAENITEFNAKNLFVPYGVILFAFLGMTAIPEAKEMLEHEKKRLKTAICIGMLIPVAVYLVFTFAVVGSINLRGFEALEPNQRIATIALGEVVSPFFFVVLNLFAVFSMFTSFMALGYALKEMFMYDYDMDRKKAWALMCFIPLFIALSSITNFIQMLNLSGIVVGALNAVIIVLMFHKAKKHGERVPEYTIKENKALSVLLVALFVAGAIYFFI